MGRPPLTPPQAAVRNVRTPDGEVHEVHESGNATACGIPLAMVGWSRTEDGATCRYCMPKEAA